MEDSDATLIAAHHLAVDQARADRQMVDCLHDKREAPGPVIAAPSQQPDARRIAPGHEPVAIVLDLVNPA
jgi:hypothetical protein